MAIDTTKDLTICVVATMVMTEDELRAIVERHARTTLARPLDEDDAKDWRDAETDRGALLDLLRQVGKALETPPDALDGACPLCGKWRCAPDCPAPLLKTLH